MRKAFAALAALALAAGAQGAPDELDTDLMHGIEDSNKSLASNIATKQDQAAGADAKEAAEMFTPASLIAAASCASAPGVFSMSMTRSTGTIRRQPTDSRVRGLTGSGRYVEPDCERAGRLDQLGRAEDFNRLVEQRHPDQEVA